MIKRGCFPEYTKDGKNCHDDSLRNKQSSIKTIYVVASGKEASNEEEEKLKGRANTFLPSRKASRKKMPMSKGTMKLKIVELIVVTKKRGGKSAKGSQRLILGF